MDRNTIDILMLTCRRPAYTRLSLPALIDSCDDTMRIWLWQNGSDPETLAVVDAVRDHERVHRYHHSAENLLLREPINWFLSRARGEFLCLVNDDCLVADGWAHTLREAHRDVAEFGAIACWHFHEDDFIPQLAERKTRTFARGRRLMINPWVQGSGVMVKRACIEEIGPLAETDRGMTPYWLRLARAGWINGWHVPLTPIDHMDDPRSPHTMLKTDADLQTHLPLSARLRGVRTVADWIAHLKKSARAVQEAPTDPRLYAGLRKKMRRLHTRLIRRELLY